MINIAQSVGGNFRHREKSLQENDTKAWKAAQEFEATFASQMIQQIFAAHTEGLMGGGETETMFRSIWAKEIGKTMVGKFGIAEAVYPLILKKQER